MIIPRKYEPEDQTVLYHYCDPTAFLAICTSKKLRFSDLFSMNDSMEMQWGYEVWEHVARELANEVGEDLIKELRNVIYSSGFHGLLVASCFSMDGDVLSQWRAYTDDAQGYAIGFRAKDLSELPVRPLKILYEKKEQIEELKKIVLALREFDASEKEKFGGGFRTMSNVLAFDLAAFKNPAFVEEKEVRLVHLLDFEESNDFLRLVDAGGQFFGEEVEGVPIQFRMRRGEPVPYIELDFSNKNTINPIKEIIIGPKNDVMPATISIFLETSGIGSVKIRKSEASYR